MHCTGIQRVVLGLGSNILPQQNLSQAIQLLRERFAQLELSPVYETRAVGFSGPNFWNLVAGIHTELSLHDFSLLLRDIEMRVGRQPQAQKWADRCIDIDILLFGDWGGPSDAGVLPRADILHYAHVLAPLADLYPRQRHAKTGVTFAEHWQDFSGDKTGIVQRFPGHVLS
ncbi:MAG: hypothetical protein RL497_1948 [Pseudomonadota bacterium]|jgi:2-amino-4-hydroxy-6-hydroxymethyldihydropteridine diphosphokinase